MHVFWLLGSVVVGDYVYVYVDMGEVGILRYCSYVAVTDARFGKGD